MRIVVAAAAALLLTAAAAGPSPTRDVAYGSAPLQRLDLYPAAANAGGTPLIVFVHGGGWSRGSKGNATGAAKATHFPTKGWAFATIDYRLVPDATVEQSAQDVADAIGYLIRNAATYGIDPRRVVVMGHSAGAHLAALVATDPQYLRKAGVPMAQLAGAVLLDGAAYDVPRQMSDGARIMPGTYRTAFGTDPARQRSVSPTLQAAAPNAARFLILHIDRADGRRQSAALAQALTGAGSTVELHDVGGRGLLGHLAINRSLGDTGYAPTAIVDTWLAAVFGR